MSLVVIGVFLCAVGAADVCRAVTGAKSQAGRVAASAVGSLVLAAGLIGVRIDHAPGAVVGVVMAACLLVWVHASSISLVGERYHWRWRNASVAALGTGLLVAALAERWVVPALVQWPSFLHGTVTDRWPATDLIVAAGVVLVQLGTANVLVLLALQVVGAPARPAQLGVPEGRLLGPLERLIIVGLGGAGQLVAAAILLGIKVLAPSFAPDRSSALHQRYLVASFLSWTLALAGVGLIHLA